MHTLRLSIVSLFPPLVAGFLGLFAVGEILELVEAGNKASIVWTIVAFLAILFIWVPLSRRAHGGHDLCNHDDHHKHGIDTRLAPAILLGASFLHAAADGALFVGSLGGGTIGVVLFGLIVHEVIRIAAISETLVLFGSKISRAIALSVGISILGYGVGILIGGQSITTIVPYIQSITFLSYGLIVVDLLLFHTKKSWRSVIFLIIGAAIAYGLMMLG